MKKSLIGLTLLLASFAMQLAAVAKDEETQEAAPAPPQQASESAAPTVTHHAIVVDGQRIAYTATAGYIPITDESGKTQARIFYVAYTRDDVPDASARPLTFAFNGGPGASSMWLHLGVGPKRVVLPAEGTVLPDRTQLVDNELTWLPFTDLVFVDPVGTGFSRAGPGVDAKQFYDVRTDIQIAAGFVRRYVTRVQRWLSPKFVLGESYGTTRAAGLLDKLQDAAGMNVRGAILVSSALDFQTFSFDRSNDLAYGLVLPAYTAVAHFHGKLPPSTQQQPLDELMSAAKRWAATDYLVALARGDAMPEDEQRRVAEQLSKFTGLPPAELLRDRLRVDPASFGRRLLRDQSRLLGRLDGRVTTATVRGLEHGEDPAFFLVTGPLVEAINHYFETDLGIRTDTRYEFLSHEANSSWRWLAGGQGYLYVADDLAQAISRDNRLRAFVAAGYYDLATPWLAQQYTVEHMGLPAPLRANVTFRAYATGHQLYTDPASARALRDDVSRFVTCAVAGNACPAGSR
jgi:carboxypeptidase C (cathepsin A)